MADSPKMTKKQKDDFLEKALKRFDYCRDNTNDIRNEALKDLKFKNGDQWSDAAKRDRERDSRPCKTINRIQSFVNQVVNDGLQNVPAVKVRPTNDVIAPITAKVIGGMIRHIINNGDSKTAFDTAYDGAVSCGLGYFRVTTDYIDNTTDKQEIKIDLIPDPLTVYFPVGIIKQPDYSDAPYCFIRTKFSKEYFDERFPEYADKRTSFSRSGLGDTNWTTRDEVWVAEYYVREEEHSTLYLLADGTTSTTQPVGPVEFRSRDVCTYTVKWYLITEFDILDSTDFIGDRIPVIPILGQEQIVNGLKSYVSLTRALISPQEMFNFWYSAYTETIALAPKAPYLIDGKGIEGYEAFWENSNIKPLAYLPFRTKLEDGTMIAPPQRINPPEVGTSILQGIQYANEFMKEVSGIYDASLGATSNERTGKAILARARQGSVATYHFLNSYNRAMRSLGKLLKNMIPEIYDTARSVMILGEDSTSDVMMINQLYQPASGDPYEHQLCNIKAADYDLVITVGPSYDTKRMETVDMMMNLFQTNPNLTMICGDILAKKMDFDDNNKMGDRIKRYINITTPGVIDENDLGTPEQKLQQQIQEMAQDVQKLMQKGQMDEAEKQQLRQIAEGLAAQLKDKSDDLNTKKEITLIKADAELTKKKMEMMMQSQQLQHDAGKHVSQMAVDLHTAKQAEPTGGQAEE